MIIKSILFLVCAACMFGGVLLGGWWVENRRYVRELGDMRSEAWWRRLIAQCAPFEFWPEYRAGGRR